MAPVVTELEDAPTDGSPSSLAATLIKLASTATAPKRANALLLRISLLRFLPKRSIIILCCFVCLRQPSLKNVKNVRSLSPQSGAPRRIGAVADEERS